MISFKINLLDIVSSSNTKLRWDMMICYSYLLSMLIDFRISTMKVQYLQKFEFLLLIFFINSSIFRKMECGINAEKPVSHDTSLPLTKLLDQMSIWPIWLRFNNLRLIWLMLNSLREQFHLYGISNCRDTYKFIFLNDDKWCLLVLR